MIFGEKFRKTSPCRSNFLHAKMRNQRAKKYRKAMAIYQTSFNFREPYQVLLSSDFILAAHRFKMDLASLLQKTLQAPLKLSTTPDTTRDWLMSSDHSMLYS